MDDFEDLYTETRDDVYAYVATLVRDPATAEDVTAQAFERAYRKAGSFDARRGTRRGWLFGIARNAALDELRRRSRQATPVAEPDAGYAPGHEDGEVDDPVQRAAVVAALRGLKTRERELIALRYYADLSQAEIARVLGVTPSNAATLLHRAMTKLREACLATA